MNITIIKEGLKHEGPTTYREIIIVIDGIFKGTPEEFVELTKKWKEANRREPISNN
jgi:hypothetical protein